jgi:hypothetical protein
MIEPLNMFRSQWQTAKIKGKADEHIVLTRSEKSNSQTNYNYIRKGTVKRKTAIVNGDFITVDNDEYFVTGSMPTQVKLIKTNCIVDIYKVTGSTASGFTKALLFTGNPGFQRTVSDNMRLYDAGLLSTTVKKFILPMIDIALTNRIVFNGINYSINAIDNSKYENLLEVQVEPDKRNTK